jgi:acetoin:2,6-dichlorophenolindophenol oxidoreductase subunit alpha
MSPESLRDLYIQMLRLRRIELRLRDILLSGEIICPVHLYTGQEAIAVGACRQLHAGDFVFSTHRSHGHYLAKGGDLKAMLAEIFGRIGGCSSGHGGSMHLSDFTQGFPGSSAIVGASIPLAVGAALAFKRQNMRRIAIAFFGDGATNEGVWYESLNLAALWKVPVIFICENNLYSTHMPVTHCLADTEIYRKAKSFCIPAERIDGNNVVEVHTAVSDAVTRARKGEGPTLIECLTYRWHGHVGPNDDLDKGLRSPKEHTAWLKRDPVSNFAAKLISKNLLTEAIRQEFLTTVEMEIDDALTHARNSPQPETKKVLEGTFRS